MRCIPYFCEKLDWKMNKYCWIYAWLSPAVVQEKRQNCLIWYLPETIFVNFYWFLSPGVLNQRQPAGKLATFFSCRVNNLTFCCCCQRNLFCSYGCFGRLRLRTFKTSSTPTLGFFFVHSLFESTKKHDSPRKLMPAGGKVRQWSWVRSLLGALFKPNCILVSSN